MNTDSAAFAGLAMQALITSGAKGSTEVACQACDYGEAMVRELDKRANAEQKARSNAPTASAPPAPEAKPTE